MKRLRCSASTALILFATVGLAAASEEPSKLCLVLGGGGARGGAHIGVLRVM
jgi:predicted acylesterase/phospholipase RssA